MKHKVNKKNIISLTFSIFTALTVLALAGVFNVYAQKNKSTKKSANKKRQTVVTKTNNLPGNLCIPPESDYLSILQMDKNSNLTLTKQTNGSSEILFNSVPISSLNKILSSIDKKSVVTFKADPALNFGLVSKTLSEIRNTTNSCINIENSNETYNQYVYVPHKPQPKIEIYPNPLFLLVELNKNMNLTLNNEPEGTLNDTTQLKNFLKQIFKDREDNGVFREGANEIETTVLVKAHPDNKFGDLIKIIDAIKEAGASPVGLQIDDLESLNSPFIIEEKP